MTPLPLCLFLALEAETLEIVFGVLFGIPLLIVVLVIVFYIFKVLDGILNFLIDLLGFFFRY